MKKEKIIRILKTANNIALYRGYESDNKCDVCGSLGRFKDFTLFLNVVQIDDDDCIFLDDKCLGEIEGAL